MTAIYGVWLKRFWSNMRPADEKACMEWSGKTDSHGYGEVTLGGVRRAHRIAWTLTNGAIPSGLCVLHRCDNPPCCNPEHLFLGTDADNVADMDKKGRRTILSGDEHWTRANPHAMPTGDAHHARLRPERLARGERHGSHTHPERLARGEANGCSKLAERDVFEILLLSDSLSRRELARQYRVDRALVARIIDRKIWRHVVAPERGSL